MLDLNEVTDFIGHFAVIQQEGAGDTLECNYCSSGDYLFDEAFGGNILLGHLDKLRDHIKNRHPTAYKRLSFMDKPSDQEIQTTIESIKKVNHGPA